MLIKQVINEELLNILNYRNKSCFVIIIEKEYVKNYIKTKN